MLERVSLGESSVQIVPFIILPTLIGTFGFFYWRFRKDSKPDGTLIYPEIWN